MSERRSGMPPGGWRGPRGGRGDHTRGATRGASGPGGSRRPGRPGRGGPGDRSRGLTDTAERPAGSTGSAGSSGFPGAAGLLARRPRLTGRSLVLVLVVAVLAVSYASSLKAYLQQREHIAELKAQIADRSEKIDALEREKKRWDDEAYVRAQARERFGYLMPGETAYVVLDEDGEPLEGRSELHDPDQVLREPPQAWWQDAWTSVELAGNPPRQRGLAPASELGRPAG